MAKQKSLLTISINNEYVKIIEISKQVRGYTVHKAVTIPTPERSYSDGVIRDRASLAKAMKIAIDNHSIMCTDVIFTVSSTKIPTKEVIIPAVKSKAQIDNIINTNLTEYFPVNIDDYLCQHVVLEKIVGGPDDGKLKVLVMMAPSEMIDGYYDLASTLGLNVNKIDYAGNSIYQALKTQIDNDASVVVQIENDSTIVNVFENGVLQLQRTIPYGKSVVVNAVMDKFGGRYETSLKKLQEEELVRPTFDGDDDITDSLRYLVANINRVVDYYTSRNNSNVISKAYVIGNATTIKGFIQLLANEMNLPLMSIDTLKDVTGDKKTYIDEAMLPAYITNIGAMIEPVNFVPKSVKASSTKKDDSRLIKVVLGLSVVAAAAIVIVPFVLMTIAKNDRDTWQKNVDKIKSVQNVVDAYYNAYDINTEAQTFKMLTNQLDKDALVTQFIEDLQKVLPSDVSFKSLNIMDGKVTFTATSSGKPSMALLEQKISDLKYTTNVVSGAVTEVKDTNGARTASFSVTCELVNVGNLNNTDNNAKAAN